MALLPNEAVRIEKLCWLRSRWRLKERYGYLQCSRFSSMTWIKIKKKKKKWTAVIKHLSRFLSLKEELDKTFPNSIKVSSDDDDKVTFSSSYFALRIFTRTELNTNRTGDGMTVAAEISEGEACGQWREGRKTVRLGGTDGAASEPRLHGTATIRVHRSPAQSPTSSPNALTPRRSRRSPRSPSVACRRVCRSSRREECRSD